MTWMVQTPEHAAELDLAPLLIREPLETLFDQHGLGSGPIEADLIGEGNSNITIRVRRNGSEFVLRRPPRPPFQQTAHDVLREARIQQALAVSEIPVPRILLSHASTDILGVPFYVMEWLDGYVLTSLLPPPLDQPGEKRAIVRELVRTLAILHQLDWRKAGLSDLSRHTGGLPRQLRRWRSVWVENSTRELPAVEKIADWLTRNMPAEGPITLVHGDYRLGNVMFGRTLPSRLTAVLDWEIATLGDPLLDVGWLLSTYPEPGDDSGTLLSLASCLSGVGSPSRSEIIGMYEYFAGRELPDLRWYIVFSFWRAAVGLESLYRRQVAGTAVESPFLIQLDGGVPELVDRAFEVLQHGYR